MNTIQKIINNQKDYKSLILKWFTNELKEAKKTLFEIKSNDDFIKSEVEKLKNKFKKTLYKKEVDKLFFMHPNRNQEFYAWWDVKEQEVFILSYGKK